MTLAVLLLWISFFLLVLVFVLMALPSLGNSDHIVVLVPIEFPVNSKQDA